MNPAITIATGDDLRAVEAIVVDAYSPYMTRIGRKPGPMLDDYAALIQQGLVRIAVSDGAVQGVLVLILEADVMLLDNVAVAPSAQGMGVGRVLLSYAEDAARDAGCSSIRLYTHESMTENIMRYTRLGYVETHRGEEKGLRRLYMTKALGPP